MDDSNPSASEMSSPPTFHPWIRLPAELQLIVLDIDLRMAQPISFRTHFIHLIRVLASLTLTSKKMRNLSLQSYYSSGIRVQWGSILYQHEGNMNHQWKLAILGLDACLFVHRVVLTLRVEHPFKLDMHRPTEASNDLLKGTSLNQWFLLFRTDSDNEWAKATRQYSD